MSKNHESVLWIVECLHPHKLTVFRTRKAARDFANASNEREKASEPNTRKSMSAPYFVHRGVWGPDA